MTQSEIGAWLADRREAAGLTQDKAAAKAGIGTGLLSKWERGELRMRAGIFLELVVLYGAQQALFDLLGGAGLPADRVAVIGPQHAIGDTRPAEVLRGGAHTKLRKRGKAERPAQKKERGR